MSRNYEDQKRAVPSRAEAGTGTGPLRQRTVPSATAYTGRRKSCLRVSSSNTVRVCSEHETIRTHNVCTYTSTRTHTHAHACIEHVHIWGTSREFDHMCRPSTRPHTPPTAPPFNFRTSLVVLVLMSIYENKLAHPSFNLSETTALKG